MLYININTPTEIAQRQWHVGEPKPIFRAGDVTSVQADCDELDYIISRFVNIPFSTGRVQIWRGDLAKFIAENLV